MLKDVLCLLKEHLPCIACGYLGFWTDVLALLSSLLQQMSVPVTRDLETWRTGTGSSKSRITPGNKEFGRKKSLDFLSVYVAFTMQGSKPWGGGFYRGRKDKWLTVFLRLRGQ